MTDAENVDFVILSDDWTKTLHLQTDRSLSVHTAASVFYSTRVPTAGRALAYHFSSCDALVGAAGHQIFRLNLDQGRFSNPLDCEGQTNGVNTLDVNPAHGLISAGTQSDDSNGTVEFFDLRARNRVGILQLPSDQLLGASSFGGSEYTESRTHVTALASKDDGLNLAVGTSTGHTLLYDLRANAPYTIKDQGYGLPVKKIEWCSAMSSADHANEAAGLVASVDAKVMKIWGSQTGKNLISINPPNDINDMHIYPGSGLVFLANEASPITAYYIPQLGMAPKWCRFLDNMTEELEEDTVDTLYDDYKFIDRNELRSLGMDHLIGTDVLKPYMHGFFVDLRLYTQARAIANPFAYAEHRDKLVRDKLEKERESRIRQSKNSATKQVDQKLQEALHKAKVNKDLAEKIRQREDERDGKHSRKRAVLADSDTDSEENANEEYSSGHEDEPIEKTSKNGKTKAGKGSANVLTDDRFGALFQDPEFQIDQDSVEYAMLNPSSAAQRANKSAKDRQSLAEAADAASEDGDSSDGDDLLERNPSASGSGRSLPEAYQRRKLELRAAEREQSTHKPRLVAGDGRLGEQAQSNSDPRSTTFGQRAAKAVNGTSNGSGRSGRTVSRGAKLSNRDEGPMRSTSGGGMEYTFTPSTTTADDSRTDKEQLKAMRVEKQARERLAAGRIGAGLEKGSGATHNAREQLNLSESDRGGRKTMRRQVRSASRNKTRFL